ncbi:hypothetical protein [Hahella ganghwensis]|uniref:hypothetical protein n=1 Tax=Hahella ganghwensis TaxID=286420 RepID=UPI00035EB57A|nr:hypothetical protein [Hahella ganghwensis]
MNWSDIGKTVGKVAPTIGTLLGGPGGAVLGTAVASLFGVNSKPDEVAKALKSDPQAALKLREFEIREAESLQDFMFKMEESRRLDRSDARANHKTHWMPSALTLASIVMVSGMFYLLAFGDPNEKTSEVVYLIVGQVMGVFTSACAYWVGTTKGSSDKNKWLGREK